MEKRRTNQVECAFVKAEGIVRTTNKKIDLFSAILFGILSTDNLTKFLLRYKYSFSNFQIKEYFKECEDIKEDDVQYVLDLKNQISEFEDAFINAKRYKNKVLTTNDLTEALFDTQTIERSDFSTFLLKHGINKKEFLQDISANIISVSLELPKNATYYYEKVDEENIVRYVKFESINENHKKRREKMNTSEFEKFAINMTNLYNEGSMDPVIGREKEIARVITILSKRIKNNPIILGEPGIGKTALVEGLVQRIANGNVPENLKSKVIYSLNLNSMVSGTKYRGDLEERLNKVLKEIENNKNIIIFIDEIHMILAAGKTSDTTAISDVFKPYLSRGNMTIIGATTLNEYKATIEKDGALERRFQPIILNEPTKEETFKIIMGIKSKYEKYHNVKIDKSIINFVIELSIKYITDRNLPDKAIDLLDEACVWTKLNSKKGNYLSQLAVRTVISDWKNLNISEISNDEFKKRKMVKEKIKSKVVGQDEAIDRIMKQLNLVELGFTNDNRPKASFLFLGSSGVGKTFCTKVLAENLYDEKSLIRLDMSEYMDKESVNKIIGSPPGYIGFDSTNTLTEKVRRNAQSIVLFDEVDKAHPDVINLLLQILDEGFLNDSYGRKINFEQTIVILTANSASYNFNKTSVGFASEVKVINSEESKNAVISSLKKSIKKEILDRLDDIIVFNDLTYEDLSHILMNEISILRRNFKKKYYNIKIDSSVYDYLFDKLTDVTSARQIKNIVKVELYNFIMDNILEGNIKPKRKYILRYFDKYELISNYNADKIETYT